VKDVHVSITLANGVEVILQLAIENAWLGDISFSIYENKPSNVYIETLEDCEFYVQSRN
jgi:hypothetical protein